MQPKTADTGVSNPPSRSPPVQRRPEIQVGANSGASVHQFRLRQRRVLGGKGLCVGDQESAARHRQGHDAINLVSSQRAYSAHPEPFRLQVRNLETSSQNLTSAESSIRDVDMAAEMTKFTNANILSQASTAMLAQANSLPQNVLSLLG
jgi:flagellin